jgi:PAS domain S-box-containing protein
MDATGSLEIINSIKKLLAELRKEIEHGIAPSSHDSIALINERIQRLEKVYEQLLSSTDSENSLKALIKIQAELEENHANLISQIENSTDRIWSVDKNLQIKTINSNFKREYHIAFGVDLKKGVSVLISLPEPLKSVWAERYKRALAGEQFSIVDRFEFEKIPHYIETSFNPVKIGNSIVGVACFSRDITKQKESEEQFKSLAKLTPNPISIISDEGYLYVNNAWQNLFGYSFEEAKNAGPSILFPKDEQKVLASQLKEFLEKDNENYRNTIKVVSKDNKTLWLDVSTTHIEFNNKRALLSVSTDITESLALQRDLKESRANLLALIENTHARIWSVDSNLKVLSFNSNFQKDYKLAFGIDLKKGVSALAGVEDPLKTVWEDRYKKVLLGNSVKLVEEFGIEGIPQFIDVTLTPIRLDNKIIGVSCFSQDITEKKRAEIALKESENRYKTLVENLPSTTYRCALDKNWTMEFISDDVENLSGYPAADFIGNNKRSFTSIIHSNDRLLVEKAVQQSIENQSSYRIEYQITHKNGTIKWVHEQGRAVFDDEGKVLWLDGVITDITSRKQAEAALRESEEQYRAIFNSMSDIFLRTDLQGNILIVSPSILDIFGYIPEEIVGKSILDLYKDPQKRKNLVSELSGKGFVREYEITFLAKNGEERIASINAKLLVNEDGKPYGIEGVVRDVTLQKMAQRTLEERTRELDSIFDNTPIILLLIDNEGRVLNINKAGTNYTQKEDSQFTSLLAGEAVKCVNTLRSNSDCGKGEACENCTIRKTLQRTFTTKQNQKQIEGSLTMYIDQQDIERKFLISTAFIPFEEGDRVLISLDDITEMRNAEEEIRRLSAAVEQSTATIVITDIRGHIEYVNPQFEKSTGYKTSEVIGKNPRILKSEELNPVNYEELWKTILNGETWHGEFLNVKKDKTRYWESAIISPITNRKGTITHFIAIKEDITERKRIQEELIHSERGLREMNEEKSRYLSILAHDLRGLVGSFHAYSNLIQTHFDEFSEDDLRKQLLLLTKASGDSLNLLDNLLAWGKSTQGRLILDFEKVNLHKQVDLVIGVLNEVAAKKEIELINNTPSNFEFHTDVNVFQTIVRNLINNGVKFTNAKGSITLGALPLDDEKVEISVTDTGIGMDNTTREKLFRLGEKTVREGTNKEQGTGLGLVICKEMVEKLGGTIKVESEPDRGSKFSFVLPLDFNKNKN